jgi:hypothetical protein
MLNHLSPRAHHTLGILKMRGIPSRGLLLVALVFKAGMVDNIAGPDCTEFFAGINAICYPGSVGVDTCHCLCRAPKCARVCV